MYHCFRLGPSFTTASVWLTVQAYGLGSAIQGSKLSKICK